MAELLMGTIRSEAYLQEIKRLQAALEEAETRVALAETSEDLTMQEIERVVARAERAEQALRDLSAWADRMPDAGFSYNSPRWGWWNDGALVRAAAREVVEAEQASPKESGSEIRHAAKWTKGPYT